MLNYTGLENKNVLVVGLAKSGYEAAKLLSKLGANVTVVLPFVPVTAMIGASEIR
ncbi:hypothetical protein IDG68_15020 [Staphylococcus sp. EG-SA-21]|nr:hypothetical protein [Staphylococcus sp. EG-SA-21]